MSKNANDQIEIARRLINKNYGLGRIFKYLRSLKNYQLVSDICLFRMIVMEVTQSSRKISIKSINYHFNKNVSKEDYDGSKKIEILHDLYYSET